LSVTGIAITKQFAFRDSIQEFTNVYHYFLALNPTVAQYQSLKDQLVTFEKALHGTNVTFTFYRIWSAGGTKAENEMLEQGPLSGAGTAPADSSVDRERAFLVQWAAGLDSRGHPVKLRKWYHLCAPVAGITLSGPIQAQTAGFSGANQTAMDAQFDTITDLDVAGVNFHLCAESARLAQGSAKSYKYLEHHQLGDQWRGA
jgi:hypothetical protein